MKVLILDDYLRVARHSADWDSLPAGSQCDVLHDPIVSEAERLQIFEPYDVIVAMRERTAFPASLIERLRNLRLLVTPGMRNASIDLEACRRRGIVVCGAPGGRSSGSAAEQAWAHSLARSILRRQELLALDGVYRLDEQTKNILHFRRGHAPTREELQQLIDIIARRRRAIAFVEVKTREDLGAAGEAITLRQRERIQRAAGLYLARQPALAMLDARFDAILVLPWRWPIHIRDAWRP